MDARLWWKPLPHMALAPSPPKPFRVTGRPGVVVATGGPGLTNTMTAAASAYAESQPMLIVSAGMPTGSEGQDLGQLHETKNTCAVS